MRTAISMGEGLLSGVRGARDVADDSDRQHVIRHACRSTSDARQKHDTWNLGCEAVIAVEAVDPEMRMYDSLTCPEQNPRSKITYKVAVA